MGSRIDRNHPTALWIGTADGWKNIGEVNGRVVDLDDDGVIMSWDPAAGHRVMGRVTLTGETTPAMLEVLGITPPPPRDWFYPTAAVLLALLAVLALVALSCG